MATTLGTHGNHKNHFLILNSIRSVSLCFNNRSTSKQFWWSCTLVTYEQNLRKWSSVFLSTSSHAYKCSALHFAGVSVPCVGQPGPPKQQVSKLLKLFDAPPRIFLCKKVIGQFWVTCAGPLCVGWWRWLARALQRRRKSQIKTGVFWSSGGEIMWSGCFN